jgi:hypothetical protein
MTQSDQESGAGQLRYSAKADASSGPPSWLPGESPAARFAPIRVASVASREYEPGDERSLPPGKSPVTRGRAVPFHTGDLQKQSRLSLHIRRKKLREFIVLHGAERRKKTPPSQPLHRAINAERTRRCRFQVIPLRANKKPGNEKGRNHCRATR